MTESLENRLKRMMVERLFLRVQPEEIDESKSLITHYGVDSVSLLELVVGLEEEFGISVEDREFDVAHFETVNALAAFVRQKMATHPDQS
ncbi:MAG: acyl carrier protein [Kiritimatiellae bacterium]|nr:acyl carrier protein [Kiritimatiellia bacterium]